MESATMSNLSPQQRSILKWLIKCVHFAKQHNRSLLETGFVWGINIKDKARENSRRASLCRTLARLEKRGLIKRIKGRKNARTTSVLLTPEGHRVAQALAATTLPY